MLAVMSAGDDGAAALARGLASGSRLQRLWLQHNAIGAAGAQALCRAMRHTTSCTHLKLQPDNEGVPSQLAQAAQQLARQNRGWVCLRVGKRRGGGLLICNKP
jgi:Ran GTPase-activating protein (RanGAP) involved in mRNA processing and transport